MMDILSEVLEELHLTSWVPKPSEMSAPWGVSFPSPEEARPPLQLMRPDDLEMLEFPAAKRPDCSFIVLTRGSCWLEIQGMEPLRLVGGDLALIPRISGYQLRDDLTSSVKPIWEMHSINQFKRREGMVQTGSGEKTSFISGLLFFEDKAPNRLLGALPPMIHIKGEQGQSVPWLENTLKFMTYETANFNPGSQSVINRLAHILFIQAVRAYVLTMPNRGVNWLGAILDREIGPVLGLMHRQTSRQWTVGELAEAVAMSRSSLASKFTERVGMPPLQYLTECRMHKAIRLLNGKNTGIKEIAQRVGYQSEAAFSNAFRRFSGMPPSQWRRKNKAGVDSGT